MAYTSFIPKIEYLKGSFTGTLSIGSDTITLIADTSLIEIGMYLEQAGIPAGATVLSKTASTVVMSLQSTAAGAVLISRGHRITFTLPPKKDPLGESTKFIGKTLVAKSGAIQTNEDYLEKENRILFSHVPQTIKDTFEAFLTNHAFRRREFSYFEDAGEPTSELIVTTSLRYNNAEFKIMTRKGGGKNFLWIFKLDIRRVL